MNALPPFVAAFLVGLVALAFLVATAFGNREDSPALRWQLFFAVAVFPSLALLMGTGRALDAMKTPTFCGSCHVMGPWVADLQDRESKNLAAVHYQNRFILENQCYTCHTDYGLTGPLEAKLNGILHLLRYEVGTYEWPIKLYQPYRFANCLHCHSESKRYQEAHTDVAEAIADGSMVCTDCHNPVHPEPKGPRP